MVKRVPRLAAIPAGGPDPTELEAQIERERRRLSRAQAVLGCLRVGLTYGIDERRVDFADVAQVACDLVGMSVDRLEGIGRPTRPAPSPRRKRRSAKDIALPYLGVATHAYQ